ncbi:ammonium transporter [Amphibacillus jilinensis]|uniref:ammonium transporter n=1 Tax=Amphibacillus jilinensis TaxID=1216008 RepID=UPI0002F0DDC3|nr:ammonium transporter family protein [Amphibacillus jilinensis]
MVVLPIAGMFSILLAFIFFTIAYTTDKNNSSSAFHKLLVTITASIAFVLVGSGLLSGDNSVATYQSLGSIGEHMGSFFGSIALVVIAAVIASSAIDERAKPVTYLIISLLVGGLLWPLLQRWTSASGWLAQLGFRDTSGLGTVHLTMGVVAGVSAWIVGPRLGKYNHNRVQALPSQSLFLASIGVVFAWLGWGLLALMILWSDTLANAEQLGRLVYNFFLIPSISFISTSSCCYFYFKRFDMSLIYNGLLMGIVVASTVGSELSLFGAVGGGLLSGALVVYVISWIDKKLKIDDPIGLITVHGVGGLLALGLTALFPEGGWSAGFLQLFNQLLTSFILMGIAAVAAVLILKVIDIMMGLRVSEEEESFGLDSSIYRLPNRYGSLSTINVGKVPKKVALNSSGSKAVDKVQLELDVKDLAHANPVPEIAPIRRFEILTSPDRLERLTQELNEIGVSGLNVANVTGFGVQKGHKSFYRGIEVESHFLPKIKLETIVSTISTEVMLQAIQRALYTGHIGDGKIFISSIQDVVRVSTGATGKDALIYVQED